MKIMHLINSLDVKSGGPAEGILQYSQHMVQDGHDVQVVSMDAPDQVIDTRYGSTPVCFLGPKTQKYGYTNRLEPWLREHGPSFDIIVVHGLWQYHGYCTAKLSRSIGLRYVVIPHGMLDPYFAKEYPLKHLKKWLYWQLCEYRVLRDARLTLFTTAEELELARHSFKPYRVHEHLMGYGITPRSIVIGAARGVFLARFPELRDKRCLLFLSRIHPKKGCDLLIDAFAKVAGFDPKLHLVMTGPDETGWQAELERRIEKLGISDRVTFTGLLTGVLKWGAFDASDVFILPTHQENFGIVLAEALASGLPVLTTNKVGIWKEIRDFHAGFIAEDTAIGTDELLSKWLALDRVQSAQMRRDSLNCFQQCFEIGRVTGKYMEALKKASTAI